MDKPHKTLAMFPGQGSQSPGMGKSLIQDFPKTKLIFEQAEDTSKLLIMKYCCDENYGHELKKTMIQQPCLLTMSYALWRVLQEESGFNADIFAGHSLGEYSALVAAKKLQFDHAVQLVKQRGEAMQAAVPLGQGAMAAVLRYTPDELKILCQDFAEQSGQVVEVVNFNSPQQQIISGHIEAVQAVCKALKAKRVLSKQLPVSAPFHSSLMTPAKTQMIPFIENTPLVDSPHPVIANLTGKIATSYTKDLLLEQIDHPVLWEQSLHTAEEEGATTYVDIGPSKVLWGLAEKTFKNSAIKILKTTCF